MTFFCDLSDYEYHKTESQGIVKNVGWLSPDHAFEKGDLPLNVVREIEQITKISVLQTRGFFECEFCCTRGGLRYKIDGTDYLLGDAEIRVFSKEGISYACPNMLVHYIVTHNYLPPAEFLDAICNGIPPSDPEYFGLLARDGLEWEMACPVDHTGEVGRSPVHIRIIKKGD